MKVFLVHHALPFTADENPARPLTETGRAEAERIAAHLAGAGITPARVLHSGKSWTRETAERVAAALGTPESAQRPPYDTTGNADVAPFVADIRATCDDNGGDIVMNGHHEFMIRTASSLMCGDDRFPVIQFKPDNGTLFCLESTGPGDAPWRLIYGLRMEHMSA